MEILWFACLQYNFILYRLSETVMKIKVNNKSHILYFQYDS